MTAAFFSRRRGPSPFGNRLLGPRVQEPRHLRIRVQLLLTIVLLANNMVGAVAVFVINSFVVPTPGPNRATTLALAVGVPTYVVAAAAAGVVWGTSATLQSLRWATLPDTAPNEEERRRALRVPAQLTVMQFVLWLGGTVLFTVLAVILQPERAVSTGLTVGIGAVIVAGIAYLLTEFALRPVAARALEGTPPPRVRGVGVGQRMVLFWTVGTAMPIIGLAVAALLSLTEHDTTLRQLAIVTLVVCGVVLVTGMFVTVLNARAVVAPIMSVRDAMQAVEAGDLDADVVVYDGTELGQLQSGFNQMVAGLRERERIRDLFGRHVGHEVAEAAAAVDTGELHLGGEARVVSVLFVDLVGSTTYATEHGPVEVVSVLNRFFGVVVDEVARHDGLVNKFIGDAVLAVFGAPAADPDHAINALAAARSMAARLEVEVPEIGAGIGVSTGMVVAGNVGHEQRFEYTVIGDAVNSASRLTDLAKDVPGRVLAMWHTVEVAGVRGAEEAERWARDGATVLRGRTEETPLAVPVDPASGG